MGVRMGRETSLASATMRRLYTHLRSACASISLEESSAVRFVKPRLASSCPTCASRHLVQGMLITPVFRGEGHGSTRPVPAPTSMMLHSAAFCPSFALMFLMAASRSLAACSSATRDVSWECPKPNPSARRKARCDE
jgi:hypothetical protein